MDVNPPSSPPIAPLPRFLSLRKQMVKSLVAPSVTNQDIANYWKQRRMVEEDHLSAAIKAVARVRARNLSDNDYLRFEDSLEDDKNSTKASSQKDENEDVRVGIKDWWTKSTYAYLNEPVMKLVDNPRGRSSTRLPRYCTHNSASLLTPTYRHYRQHMYQVR